MSLRVKTGVPIVAPPDGVAIAPATGPAQPAALPRLDVPLIRQTQNQWCWAACAAMIARFLGLPEPQQCELANVLFARASCCQSPGSSACNRPAQVFEIVRVYNHLGISLVGPDNPLSTNTLVAELNAGRPFEVGLLWLGGGGHVAVVYGYTAQGLILVHDPWYGSVTVTYTNLVGAYGMGQWRLSYGRFSRSS